MAALRALGGHVKTVEKATGNISAGSRVRSAADDAASLAMGTKINANRRSGLQAIRNGNDAISEMQVAEGSMNEMSAILVRLRELSVQASTDILDAPQREMLNIEYMQLRKEMDRLSQVSEFNGRKLLSGGDNRDFQIGINADSNSRFQLTPDQMMVDEKRLGTLDTGLFSKQQAQTNLSQIDTAIENLTSKRAFSGAVQNRLQSSVDNLSVSNIHSADTQSRMMDSDMAYETSEKMRGELRMQATSSILTQANNLGQNALKVLS
jgi:flagellin